MYESYIEARDSPLRDVKDYCIRKHMACGVYSFLKERLYGVILPQGFDINKENHFFIQIYYKLIPLVIDLTCKYMKIEICPEITREK